MPKRKFPASNAIMPDDFRQEYESDEHWEMRKKFILKNKRDLNEDQLRCFSQLYHNVEILGCTYSPTVMKKLARLSDDLPKREHRRQEFVKATPNVTETETQRSPTVENRLSKYTKSRRSENNDVSIIRDKKTPKIQPIIIELDTDQPEVTIHHTSSTMYGKLSEIKETIEQFTQQVTNAAQLLGVVLSKCHLVAEWKFQFAPDSKHHEPTFECECILEGFSVSRGVGKNKKSAKIDACQSLIDKLANDEWIKNIIPTKSAPKKPKTVQFPVTPVPETVIPVLENEPEVADDAQPIDLARITKLVMKYRRKHNYSVSLLEFVAKICHYSVEWRPKLVSDSKPSNDFNYTCDCVLNRNLVSKGKGKSKKKAALDACNVFIGQLEAAEADREAAKPVREDVPPVLAPVSGFVIIELPDSLQEGPVQILRNSASFNKTKVVFKFDDRVCTVTLGTNLIGEAKRSLDLKIGQIKMSAAQSALDYLRKTCYTVKMKTMVFPDSEVSKDDVKTGTVQNDISVDNIGNKLLRSMGWTGGGLGKHGTGIKEPIKCATVLGRRGFGTDSNVMTSQKFHKHAQEVIRNYVNSDAGNDLVFSSEFTNEERAVMHKIAHKFGLKTNSRGKGDNRYLVVSRKYTPQTLMRVLMECGGSNDKYDLIPPAT